MLIYVFASIYSPSVYVCIVFFFFRLSTRSLKNYGHIINNIYVNKYIQNILLYNCVNYFYIFILCINKCTLSYKSTSIYGFTIIILSITFYRSSYSVVDSIFKFYLFIHRLNFFKRHMLPALAEVTENFH